MFDPNPRHPTVTVANLDPDHPPRNRTEAAEQLGAVRALNPDGRYELRFTASGWNVVRVDP